MSGGLPAGLPNQSNACFLNSCLQLLSSVSLDLRRCAIDEFRNLLDTINLAASFEVGDRLGRLLGSLVKSLAGVGLSVSLQNDANETLVSLLDHCTSGEERPFTGQIRRHRKCCGCATLITNEVETFSVLTVSANHPTIAGCISALSLSHSVRDVECRRCTAVSEQKINLREAIGNAKLQSGENLSSTLRPPSEMRQVRTTQQISEQVIYWPRLLFVRINRSPGAGPVFISDRLSVDHSLVYALHAVSLRIGSDASSGHYATLRRFDAATFDAVTAVPRWVLTDDDRVSLESSMILGSQLVRENSCVLVYRLQTLQK